MITFYSSVTSNRIPAIIDPTEPPTFLPIPDIPDVITAITGNLDNLCNTTTISSTRIVSTDNGTGLTEDAYNFGYQIRLSNDGSILTRTDVFAYYDSLSTYTIYKSNFYDKWTLSGSSLFLSNSSYTPIGVYSPTITATYI